MYHYKKVLIVDDEPPARRKLKSMLNDILPDAELEEAKDGDEAIQLISRMQPELVFLDIHMPGENGIDVALATCNERYHLVFVTAYDEFAIKAFDTHAIDYILKPFSLGRLKKSLDKISNLEFRIPDLQLQQLARSLLPEDASQALAVKRGKSTAIIEFKHIGYIEAVSGYSRILLTVEGQLAHQTDTLLSDVALGSLFTQLCPEKFLRIHRSYIVNIDQIRSYYKVLRLMHVKLKDFPETDLPVSRRNVGTVSKRWAKV